MSERVVPTKPGWWRCSHVFSVSDEQIVHVIEEFGSLKFYGGLFDGFVDVKSNNVSWIAPVPSAEAVHAAVESLKECRDELVTLRSRLLRGVVERAEQAIAGLTVGEG